MQSMTGFGKGIAQYENFTITVYAKSVNSRYLDIVLRLPKRYSALEEKIRKRVTEVFKRGKIEIQIKYSGKPQQEKEIIIDYQLARKIKNSLSQLKSNLGFEEALSFSDFLRFRDFLFVEELEEEVEKLWEEVAPALNEALKLLKDSRLKEGEYLKEVITSHLNELKVLIKEVEKLKPEVIEENKKKLRERVEKLMAELSLKNLDENRFYQELTYLMDRLDFTEEIERLKVHVAHFEKTMEEERCGRKLDFLCQEMFREANTMSNKAQSPKISFIAVHIKDLIEKLREQIQNVA